MDRMKHRSSSCSFQISFDCCTKWSSYGSDHACLGGGCGRARSTFSAAQPIHPDHKNVQMSVKIKNFKYKGYPNVKFLKKKKEVLLFINR